MGVRKVVTRSGKRFRGKFPSRKNQGVVQWESLLERDAIRWFEYHPEVRSYAGQPRIVNYYDLGSHPHRYYPDFAVELTSGETFDVEVKPHNKLLNPDIAAKLACVATRYQELGMRFRILTEREIRLEPRFTTLKAIHRSVRQTASSASMQADLSRLGTAQQWTLREAGNLLGSANHVLRLVAHGLLRISHELALADDALVWTTNFTGASDDPVHI